MIRAFPLRPIRSDAELGRAIEVVDRLVDREDLTAEEQGYLEVLSRLIEGCEDETDPLPNLSGAEALRYLIEENGLTQAELSAQTGIPVATISEILNHRRGISTKVRGILAARFRVSPALFV